MTNLISRLCPVVRLQRFDRPVRTHQHPDRSILSYENGEIGACAGSGGFEDALGVLQEIGHEILIEPPWRI